jgi:hypothetical protein
MGEVMKENDFVEMALKAGFTEEQVHVLRCILWECAPQFTKEEAREIRLTAVTWGRRW